MRLELAARQALSVDIVLFCCVAFFFLSLLQHAAWSLSPVSASRWNSGALASPLEPVAVIATAINRNESLQIYRCLLACFEFYL